MSTIQNKAVDEKMIDTISDFLKSPPEGTPQEIIQLFGLFGTHSDLIPGVFIQTVEQAPIAIAITDPNANILYVNKAFEEFTGYQREEVSGKNQSLLSSNSTPESVYKDLWDTIKNKKVWKGRLINHRKDKKEYIAELSISPVLSSDKTVTYFLGMHQDVTELHQLEQNLNFQKSLTEKALNHAPMIVAMIGGSGQVVIDNLAYKTLQTDFNGIEPSTLFLDALQKQIGFNIDKGKKKINDFNNIEIRLDMPGTTSSRWFSCAGACIARPDIKAENYFNSANDKQNYLLLIASDITEHRQRINDARINLIRTSMIEQQMINTMRESISAAMFTLQMPMNMMKAALNMPHEDGNISSLKDTMEQVIKNSEDAMSSLQKAVPASQPEASSLINVNSLIQDVIKLSTEKLLSSSIVIDWRPHALLPLISGKANALRTLFYYLIDNAVISLNENSQSSKEIRIDTHIENKEEISIEIIDNGTGIIDSLQLKVFEPFYCGWKKTSGHAGMGLTMAQEIVLNHLGNIELDKRFYGGCRFIIRLPVHQSGEE